VARSPLNCFEFEIGALLKNNDIGLARGDRFGLRGSSNRSGLKGGSFSRLKALRVSRACKIMLEKIRLDVDRVFSRLGLRPKVPLGSRLRAGRRLIFIGPSFGIHAQNFGCSFGAFLRALFGCWKYFRLDSPPGACWFGFGY
jgi:hypothetical protein